MNSRNTKKLSQPYFENLNGLRAIGALCVFVFHAFILGHENWGAFYDGHFFKVLAQIASKGNYGVSLFFVLSGFLITYLLMHEAQIKGRIHTFAFFMRRLLRIWPVFFIVVLFGFLIFPHLPYGIQTTNSPWMYSFFLSNFEEIRHGFMDPVNFLTITWSVSIEEQFYLSWVILLSILPFMRKGRGFLPFLILVAAFSLVFRWLFRDEELTLYYHTFAVMSDLALGGLLAYACLHLKLGERFSRIPYWLNLLIYPFGILAVLASRKLFQGDLIFIEKLFLGFFFAYIIFDQVYGKFSVLKADRIPGFFYLGKISYGLYMYHCIVLYYVQNWFVDLKLTDHAGYFILYFVLSLSLTVIISALSFRFIEQPLLRLKKKYQS